MAGFRERFFPEQGNRQPPRGMREIGGLRVGISAPHRPESRGVITPDRPIAPTLPRPPQDQTLTDALTEGVIRKRKIDEQAKRKKGKLPLKLGLGLTAAGLLAGGVGLGINKALGDNEPTPVSRDINSIGPTSFTDNGLVPRAGAETTKVNPEEVFDPYAERQVITLKNFVFMFREEYKDIVPPTIDPRHPERLNVFFPIRLKEGSGERKIVIEKRIQRLSVTGGKRTTDLKIDHNNNTASYEEQFLVKSTYVIKEGLMPGDEFIGSASGMIGRGTDEPDNNGVLKGGGFRMEVKDDSGNESTIYFGGLPLKLTKDIPAATIITEKVQVGNITTSGTRLKPNLVPIQENERIGTIMKADKDPLINGQFEITVLSRVTGEDGRTQGGPAEIMLNVTPDGKLIIPKADQ